MPCSRSCAGCRTRKSLPPRRRARGESSNGIDATASRAAERPSGREGLAPLYVVFGDEPLLAIEAGDAIRAAARAAGCEEREVLVVEPGFKWDAFSGASRNLGLFGTRKLVDLRIPGGKPGVDGARVLEDCAAHPSADTTILITLPRLDRAATSSAWFAALEQAGVVIEVYPLERADLPRWIASRLQRQQQSASGETLQFLADTTEGNLLAARQELEKIGLLLPQGELAAGSGGRCRRGRLALRCFPIVRSMAIGRCRAGVPHPGVARKRGRRRAPAPLAARRGPACARLGACVDGFGDAGRGCGQERQSVGQAPVGDGTCRAARQSRVDTGAPHAPCASRCPGQGHRPRQRLGPLARRRADACRPSRARGPETAL